MRLDEPAQPEPGADLLVRDDEEDEIARRNEILARERGERDRARCDLVLHVERAAAPDLTVDQIARPRVAIPLGGVGEHRVRVGEEGERRTVATLDPGHEIRTVRLSREELAFDAVLREVVAEQLGGARLVSGRVDGVDSEERLQERCDLVPSRHPAGSILRAWPTSSPKRLASGRPRTRRWRFGCGLVPSTISSVSNTFSGPGRRCDGRSRTTAHPR